MSGQPASLKGLPLLGNLLEARHDPLQFVLKLAAVPSNLVYYRIGPFTGYLVNHPDDIQYVLRKNFHNYSKHNYSAATIARRYRCVLCPGAGAAQISN